MGKFIDSCKFIETRENARFEAIVCIICLMIAFFGIALITG